MNVMGVRFYDSVVGIATRYGLDGSGSNPGVGDIFHTVQTDPEAHATFCTMGNGSFPGLKRAERGADHLRLA
jgi:acylphosphatase